MGRIVHAAGLPAPAVGEIVEINHRRGLVYERIDGVSILDVLFAKPWQVTQLAREFAQVQAAIHACRAPELPTQRADLESAIRAAHALPPDLKAAALRWLADLPGGDTLCHGDLHPGNVMRTSHRAVVIDWIASTRGNPIADVARTLLLLTIGNPPGIRARVFMSFLRRSFCATYLHRYFELRPAGRTQIAAWQPVIAAARLNENIAGEQAILLARVKTEFERHRQSL